MKDISDGDGSLYEFDEQRSLPRSEVIGRHQDGVENPDHSELVNTAHSSIRAADADREAVVNALRRHHLEGRITLDEYEHRLGLALSAVTLGDLEAVRVDLPNGDEPDKARSWRQSAWILLTLPIGLTTWAAFLYAGLRTKRSELLVASAAYGVGLILYLLLVGLSSKNSAIATVGAVIGIITWLTGIVHALIIRKSVAEQLGKTSD